MAERRGADPEYDNLSCDALRAGATRRCRQDGIQLPAADSRVLRKGTPRTPPGPEGSNGTGQFPVPQVRLAIIRRASDKPA
jgi:hypothetical protein